MEPRQESRSRGLIALLIVLVILILTVSLYYQGKTQVPGVVTEVSSLQSQVSSLQQANSALLARLNSPASGSNSSTSGANPVALYANDSNSVVTIEGDELVTQNTIFGRVASVATVQGSGFVIEYQGSYYVVTNYHVVGGGVTNITVTFHDGNSYPANVKGSDQYSDLAVLQVEQQASEFVPLTVVGTTQGVFVGETVYAIGSPYGLTGSMTVGIISQTDRTITETSQITIADALQFSAPINPGNSGGPLIDSSGEVVGITTAGVTNSAGLYFAIPASTIVRELPSLITTGSYSLHPSLGLVGADMTYQLAKATGSNVTYGVLVQSVTSGGAASNAGVRGGTSSAVVEGTNYVVGGDIVVSVNGVRVVNTDALLSYLEENAVAGQTVQLGIIRSGASLTLSVVLGSLA